MHTQVGVSFCYRKGSACYRYIKEKAPDLSAHPGLVSPRLLEGGANYNQDGPSAQCKSRWCWPH